MEAILFRGGGTVMEFGGTAISSLVVTWKRGEGRFDLGFCPSRWRALIGIQIWGEPFLFPVCECGENSIKTLRLKSGKQFFDK